MIYLPFSVKPLLSQFSFSVNQPIITAFVECNRKMWLKRRHPNPMIVINLCQQGVTVIFLFSMLSSSIHPVTSATSLQESKNSTNFQYSCTTLQCAINDVQPVSSSIRKNGKRHLHEETSDISESKWDRFLNKLIRKKMHKCRKKGNKGFYCEKLKWARWLKAQFERNVTRINDYVQLVQDSSANFYEKSSLQPENFAEKIVYKVLQRWGDAIDHLLFYKYKQFSKSRDLKVQVPSVFQLTVAPNRHEVSVRRSSRTFWDPGFNLKLKLPFFHDELKVAVSTGPAFLAGIGVGLIVLMVKGLLMPLVWMMYSVFVKDASPWDFMKMIGWVDDHGPLPSMPPPSIASYEPSTIHNPVPYKKPGYGPPHGGYGYGPPHYDQNYQYSQSEPTYQTFTADDYENLGFTPEFRNSMEDARMQQYNSLMNAQAEHLALDRITSTGPSPTEGPNLSVVNSNSVNDANFQYIPSTALQAEVENYDPFYSPLLSRIDSIFMHLGHTEEGCRERAVCSIYKFPMKYAPYSNLLSAQLSKQQSELKRPVTSSPKILRYFRYMKAAKDGQGAADCAAMYQNCDQDTDAVSNLPMVTTFHQLSELMKES